MIRALSPYYIETDLTYNQGGLKTCENYTLNIYVWDGDLSSIPTEPNYQITYENNIDSTETHSINIAPVIRDYINFTQPTISGNTQIVNGNNQQWVHVTVDYDNGGFVGQHPETDFMTLGYSYGNEGENNTTVNERTLLNPQDYRVSRFGAFVFPITTTGLNPLESNFVSVKSYPDNEISVNLTTVLDDLSSSQVQYVWIDISDTVNDNYIEILWNDQSTSLIITDDCKYTPLDVHFQNKDGALQTFQFLKQQENGIKITSKEFESNRGQALNGYHQFIRHSVQARTTISASSGYINERENEVIKQLLLSERVWTYKDNKYTPINIKKESLKFKTRRVDRLISYDIDFELGYNEINNI